MSKAFLRESDSDEPEVLPPPISLLSPGTKNYLTPTGAQRLRNELARLTDIERPRLVAAAMDPDTKRELQSLDQRIRYLSGSLRSAEVIEPTAAADDTVRFGAHVTVREEDGSESRYQLVGVDEADPTQGSISWQSPIAKALLNARRGQRVSFKVPSGMKRLEIVAVEYAPVSRG